MKKIINLENLIYLTIFALPRYLLRFSFFGFPTNVLDGLIAVCVVWRIFFYEEKIDYKLFFEKYKPFVFSVGLIFFGLTVSVLANKNYAAGFGIIKSWFLLPLVFSLVVSSVIKEDKIKNIFLAYYISAFIVALVSLGYFFLGQITYDGRLAGIFNSPNYLAMYLAPAVFIGCQLFFGASRNSKTFFLISGAIILAALYLTFSYAAWVAAAVALVLVFILEKKINWKKVLIIIFAIIILFSSQVEKNKFSSLANLDERSSLQSRMMIWRSVEKMLADNWFWGIGAGNFQEKYLENQKYFPPYLEWAVPHPHNLFLTFWLYGGIFGLAGFIMLLYFWFAKVLSTTKNSQLKFIALGIMFYILLHGLVDTTYFKNDLAVLFWMLFAI